MNPLPRSITPLIVLSVFLPCAVWAQPRPGSEVHLNVDSNQNGLPDNTKWSEVYSGGVDGPFQQTLQTTDSVQSAAGNAAIAGSASAGLLALSGTAQFNGGAGMGAGITANGEAEVDDLGTISGGPAGTPLTLNFWINFNASLSAYNYFQDPSSDYSGSSYADAQFKVEDYSPDASGNDPVLTFTYHEGGQGNVVRASDGTDSVIQPSPGGSLTGSLTVHSGDQLAFDEIATLELDARGYNGAGTTATGSLTAQFGFTPPPDVTFVSDTGNQYIGAPPNVSPGQSVPDTGSTLLLLAAGLASLGLIATRLTIRGASSRWCALRNGRSMSNYSIPSSPNMVTLPIWDARNTLALSPLGICAVGAGAMCRRLRRRRSLPWRSHCVAVTLVLILIIPAGVHASSLGLPVITEQGAVEPTVTDSLSTRYRFDSTTSGAFAGTGSGPMYTDSGPVGTGMTGQAGGDVELTPSPSVHAYASVSKTTSDATWSLTASADSNVSYNFEILSSDASSSPTAVPIAVTASGGVTASTGAGRYSSNGDFGSANLTIFSADGRSVPLNDESSYSLDLSFSPTADATPPFFETGIYNFNTNTLYTVRLDAFAYVDITNAPDVRTDSISAFVDPVFQIAPGTPNAQNYSLEFSDGVGNNPNKVPDEGSTALMLV